MTLHKLPVAWALAVFLLAAPLAAADSPARLVPFPEDEQAPAEAKPVKPQPPKSEFQPKFRPPAVRQAQHLEPVEAKPAAEPAQETAPADNKPAEAKPGNASDASGSTGAAEGPELPNTGGSVHLDLAYQKTKTAKSESDYTAIIENCRKADQSEMGEKYHAYARQLMGWALNRRGEARAEAGQEAEALADFEAAIEASPTWRATHNRGVSYATAGKFKEAMADFDRTIELNKQYPNAYYNRGELRYKQGDFPNAVRDYTMALKLGPPDPAIYNSRGHSFYKLQKFGDALRDFGEAIRLDPENGMVLIHRGDVYSDLGQYGEAAKDYRAAVRVAPKLGKAYQSAAWLMATCPDAHYRDEKLAIDAAKRAIELDGSTFRNLTTLAAAQASAGLFKEAQATQKQAIAAATEGEKGTGAKMMALYARQEPYRDRPYTAFTPPEEMTDSEVKQASAEEPVAPPTEPTRAEPKRMASKPPAQQPAQRPAAPAAPQWNKRQPKRLPPTGR